MGSIKYDVANFAQAIAYANQLNNEMESAKSECLGILSGVNPPDDLDISGEIANVKGIIESMSTRVAEVRSTIESLRSQIESTDASIASQIAYYIGNETAYIRNSGVKIGVEQVVGSKPNPKDYADGVNDDAYIKDLEKYNLKLAAYEAFSEGKIDYNGLKSKYGEEIATEIQKAYGKEYSGWQEGEGKSIAEGVSDIATGVKDAAVLFATDPAEFYVRTKATIANTGAAVIKGGLDLVEGVMDFGTAIGGAVGAGVAKWTGHEETSKAISEKTSNFISTDWVDKAYDKIYSTAGGQWLDSKSLLTHDSQAFDTIAGFGKMAGLIAISAVASPVVGAIVAGTSAGGETIEKDFQNLGGSTSDLGEYGKTLLHGTLAGALEGGMWYAGAKVGLKGDLALSAVDPVSRTGVQMLSPTENRSFGEIFNEDYGGAKGIMTNMAFSILGNKLSDKFSSTKNVDEELIKSKESLSNLVVKRENAIDDLVETISDIDKRQWSLPKIFEGALAFPHEVLGKFVYVPLKNNKELCREVLDKGLYHFTSEEAVDKILDSRYLKSSDFLTSYGNKKSFFFAGDTPFKDYVNNVGLDYKKVAVKFNIDEANLKDFRYRSLTDKAITYAGDFNFEKGTAEKIYTVLDKKKDGSLFFKAVSKQEYDNYVPSEEIISISRGIKKEGQKWAIAVTGWAEHAEQNLKKIKAAYENAIMKNTNAVESSAKSIIPEISEDALLAETSIHGTNAVFSGKNVKDLETKVLDLSPELVDYKKRLVKKLDSYSSEDEYNKKMLDCILTTVQNDNFTDENVKTLFRNIDSLDFKMRYNPYTTVSSYVRGPNFLSTSSFVEMSSKQLDNDLSAAIPIFNHEIGHGSYHKLLDREFRPEAENALNNARNKILANPKLAFSKLEEVQKKYNSVIIETPDWYQPQREREHQKIVSLVNSMDDNDKLEEVKGIINKIFPNNSTPNDKRYVKILNDYDVPMDIEEILNNKEALTDILNLQNNVSIQLQHIDENMTSYENGGDYRKISAMINSVVKENTLSNELGEEISFSYRHDKKYWTTHDSKTSYDELIADYISLSSNGRQEALDTIEEVIGSDLMNEIKKDVARMAQNLNNILDKR